MNKSLGKYFPFIFFLCYNSTQEPQWFLFLGRIKMKQHKKLLEGMLLKESFELLKKEMTSMDSIEAIQHFQSYSELYNSVGIFTKYADNNNLIDYVKIFVDSIRNEAYLSSIKDRLSIFVPAETIDLFFAISIIGKNLDNINYLINYANKDMEQYPTSIHRLVKDNEEDLLRYLVCNMVNTHYDNDILLSQCQSLNSEFIRFLVEERGFSLNAINETLNTNFLTFTAYSMNFEAFSFVVRNFNDLIDWKQIVPAYTDPENPNDRQPPEAQLLDRCLMIYAEQGQKELYNFYNLMLSEQVSLRSHEVMRLLVYAKNNMRKFMNVEGGAILVDLFKHRNLRMEEYPESPLIYELCSRFASEAVSNGRIEGLNDVYRFTKIYLKNRNKNYVIPNSKDYHPLGAGLYIHQFIKYSADNIVASKKEEILQYKDKFVELIIEEFSDDVNWVNPNGYLPIQQVANTDREYTTLIKFGALPVEKEPNFFGSMINRIKNKSINTVEKVIEMEAARRSQRDRSRDRVKKKEDIKEAFTQLRVSLDNKIKSMIVRAEKEKTPEMVIKVLNEFQVKSSKVIDLMIRQEHFEITDEVRWLRGNFISFTEEALASYWKLIDVAKNASFGDDTEKKITAATDRLLIALTKIQTNLNITVKNIASEIEFAASSDMNLGGKFISETFNIQEKKLNQQLIKSHEREERGIDTSSVSVFDDESVDLMKHTSDKSVLSDGNKNQVKSPQKTALDDLFG